jgi:hypothetical protein
MKESRQDFLPGAGCTLQEDGGIRRGQLGRTGDQRHHTGILHDGGALLSWSLRGQGLDRGDIVVEDQGFEAGDLPVHASHGGAGAELRVVALRLEQVGER